MRGVVGQGCDGRVPIPKCNQPHHRINRAFGGFARRRILTARTLALKNHIPKRSKDAAIGGNLLHFPQSQSDVRDALGVGQGIFHGECQSLHDLAIKNGIGEFSAQAMLREQALGAEVTARCIVLMQRVHRHPIRTRVRSFRENLPERVVTLVSNAHPIDCAQYDRLTRSKQNHTPRRQRRDDLLHRFHGTIAKRRAHRRRGIDLEGRDLQVTRLHRNGQQPERQSHPLHVQPSHSEIQTFGFKNSTSARSIQPLRRSMRNQPSRFLRWMRQPERGPNSLRSYCTQVLPMSGDQMMPQA